MAFTNLGAAGSSIPKAAGTTATLTPTRTLNVGEFAVLYVGWDSDGGTTGITITLSVSDTGSNTWTRSAERLVRPSSLNGVKGAIFTSVLTTQLTTASTITVTETSSVPVAKALGLRTFSVAAGYAPQVALSTGGSSPPQSAGLAASTGSNIRCPSGADELVTAAAGRLWLALHAAETTVTTGTADADYTSVEIKTTGGSDLSNVRIRAAYRIYTGTNDTYSYSTGATSTDHVAILTCFDEISTGPFDQTITASAGPDSNFDDGRPTFALVNQAWIGTLPGGGSHVTGSTTYVSLPISPVANAVVMLWIVDKGAAGAALLTVTGCNLTWESVDNITLATGESGRLWFGWGASPTVGTVTVTYAAARTWVGMSFTQATGIWIGPDYPWDALWDSGGANGTGSLTADFGPLADRHAWMACIGGYWIRDTGIVTTESGWELIAFAQTDADQVYAAWSPGVADDTLTFSTSASSATSAWRGYVWFPSGLIAQYSSIASAAAYGSATLALEAGPGEQTITATGLASSAALGTATLTPGPVALTATGLASSAAYGTATLTPGPVTITATGLASSAAYGTATLTAGPATITATGLASTAAYGTATLTPGPVALTATGLASSAAYGTATLTPGAVAITATGIASAAAYGTATVTPGTAAITATGLASSAAYGTASFSSLGTIVASGIASSAALGTATLIGDQALVATGIASSAAYGTGWLALASITASAGIGSSAALGTATLAHQAAQALVATGLGSTAAYGTAVLNAPLPQTIGPASGIASRVTYGTATLFLVPVGPGGDIQLRRRRRQLWYQIVSP